MLFLSRACRTLSSLNALTIKSIDHLHFFEFDGIGYLSYNDGTYSGLHRFQFDDDNDDDDRHLFINILSNATVVHLTHIHCEQKKHQNVF